MTSINGTVNWGIIGCGDVCEIKSGPAFNKVQNSKLMGVMRRDFGKVKDYASRHSVPLYCTDASELIQHGDINAIYIATPPSFHEQYTEEALKMGKPVYVEKPVTISTASCERMIELSKQYNNKVSVAHYRRELPLFKQVKSLIAQGIIGKVRIVEIKVLQPHLSPIIAQTEDNWRIKPEISGGGLFFDLSPHQLDIMYWLFGEPIEVYGHSFNLSKQYDAPDVTLLQALFNSSTNQVNLANRIHANPLNQVDQANPLNQANPPQVNPKNPTNQGPVMNGTWAFNVTSSAMEDTCEIIGDKGKLIFSFFKRSTITIITENGTEVIEPDYPVNIQRPMIDAVTKYFRGEGANPCSLEDALVVMKMMESTKLEP